MGSTKPYKNQVSKIKREEEVRTIIIKKGGIIEKKEFSFEIKEREREREREKERKNEKQTLA